MWCIYMFGHVCAQYRSFKEPVQCSVSRFPAQFWVVKVTLDSRRCELPKLLRYLTEIVLLLFAFLYQFNRMIYNKGKGLKDNLKFACCLIHLSKLRVEWKSCFWFPESILHLFTCSCYVFHAMDKLAVWWRKSQCETLSWQIGTFWYRVVSSELTSK